MPLTPTLLLALLGAPVIALLAWRLRALTSSGAVAAALVGAACLGRGGWPVGAGILAFFATSTALSRVGRRRKEALRFEKGGQRDAAQVLANGGVAALCALAGFPLAALGALAAANADTWATEIGALWGGRPRRITTLRTAEVGESGAVSGWGTLAALAGAVLLGAVGAALGLSVRSAVGIGIAGLAGALADSLLGATLQVQWRDPATGRWIETPPEAPTERRGVRGVGNDVVNALATLVGALLAALLG